MHFNQKSSEISHIDCSILIKHTIPIAISFGDVFCHHIKAGIHGRYASVLVFNLHLPKGTMLLLACISSSVVCNLPTKVKKFDLLPV